jgi:acetaldehyde dehydrogenase/alcohol dehydrogenase
MVVLATCKFRRYLFALVFFQTKKLCCSRLVSCFFRVRACRYNFKLAPSLTLGCGSWGGNSISENVGPKHLINKKTVAKRAENMLWHRLPPKIYFKRNAIGTAMEDLVGKKRACIVTDEYLFNHTPYVHELIALLEERRIECEVFYDVQADPTLSTIEKGAAVLNAFQPDLIVAIGGGSPMDAAKMMWVLYEHPEVCFKELSLRFMDIRKRIYKFPKMGIKAQLVAIPTTSGTGSEVTPFAVVTDDATGQKYPLAGKFRFLFVVSPFHLISPRYITSISHQLSFLPLCFNNEQTTN